MHANSLTQGRLSDYHLTAHAELRMQQRGIAPQLIAYSGEISHQ